MKIGVCTSSSAVKGLTGIGLDFLEGHVRSFLTPLGSDEKFLKNLEEARSVSVPIEAANCFLPADMKCVGTFVDIEGLLSYADTAYKRAQQAGIEIIVFGSGDARAVPDDFPRDKAVEQMIDLLKQLGPLAERRSVTIAVEPLCTKDCNFINSLAEGAELVQGADHPNVKLLADFYHMAKDGQTAEDILEFGHLLKHVHIAEKENRTAPGKAGDDFRPYLKALKKVGYDGRISLECGWGNMREELAGSLRELRKQIEEA